VKTSEYLQTGTVYSRQDLKDMFHISDATINTGVFKPKNHNSIWLFITEKKGRDKTQYSDYLDGDTLNWDGQTSGRTDSLIINHLKNELEILVFYREKKNQFAKCGFLYHGPFEYRFHSGNCPSHFCFKRAYKYREIAATNSSIISKVCQTIVGTENGQSLSKFDQTYCANIPIELYQNVTKQIGFKCQACDFDFEATYGAIGHHIIEIHTKDPSISYRQLKSADNYLVLCSNCHRIIHLIADKNANLEYLKKILAISDIRSLLCD
jgi:hypothetical protein